MATKPNHKVSKSGKRPKYGGGSRKGIPNKVTQTAREAFAQLVEGNAPTMNEWLMQVAYGIPMMERVIEKNADGEEVIVEQQVERNGVKMWVCAPSPEKALDILQKMAEYHIPKLARTEHVGDSKQPIEHVVKFAD